MVLRWRGWSVVAALGSALACGCGDDLAAESEDGSALSTSSTGDGSSGGSSGTSDGATGSVSVGGEGESEGEGCGEPASVSFISPGAATENPIWLAVAAEGAVVRVRYSAEGVQALGESEDPASDFGVSATLETLGPRSLHAVAYDACGEAVAEAVQVTTVSEGEEDEEPGGALGEVCYPGADAMWSLCWALSAPVDPEGYTYPPPLDMSPNYRAPVAYLALSGLDLDVSIAPNFQLKELVRPDFGDFVVLQPKAVGRLQALRDALGSLAVTSGYRNPQHNMSVGGATWSRHMYGDAFDLKPNSATLQALFERCAVEGASFRQLYEDHVHCDWRDVAVDEGFFGPLDGAPASPQPPEWSTSLVRDGDGWLAPASGWDEGEPLREWRALDSKGALLAASTGRRFVPPEGSARVQVRVGGVATREVTLP
jgi:hypothetical protein